MAVIVPNEGKLYLCDLLLKGTVDDTLVWKARLYQTDTFLGASTVLADFHESTFSGYAAKDLTRPTWTSPSIVNDVAQSTYGIDFLQWTNTGPPQTCYGWYVTDPGNTVCIWAERFPAPLSVTGAVPASVLPFFRLYQF